MKRKKKYFSWFLEAPLVRQADGELKNTNGNLKEYFRAAQLGPNGGFNSGLSLASMALFSKKKSTPNPKRIKYNLSYEHEHRKRRNCCYYSLPNGANIAWLYQSDDTSFELRGLMRYTSKAFTAWRPFNVGSR